MPKINVYLPDDLATAVREAQVPVSAICQAALERAVREVSALRGMEQREPASAGPFRRFTPRARTAIELAQNNARVHGDHSVGTEHLLLGVIDEGGNLALRVLASLDVDPADLRTELVASMAAPTTQPQGSLPFKPLSKKALELSARESKALGHNYIGCEHLLLGVLATEEGLGGQVLRRMGVEFWTTRRAVVTALADAVRTGRQDPAAPPAPTAAALEQILARLEAIERRLAG